MKRGEKWFPEKLWKKTWLGKLSVRVILNTYLWEQGSRFRARVAKGKPAFRHRITRGKPRVQNCVSGRCRLRKTKKIFSANNEQSTLKRGGKWFPENLSPSPLPSLAALVLLFITFSITIQFWLRVKICADCRLLSSKYDPVINMLACESGHYCALNRELLCRLIGTNQPIIIMTFIWLKIERKLAKSWLKI